MTSRLRRMLLINTRTSGTQSSIAINELDPTDGAAVTGDNAVGKTTTLEIIPLFFGASPSQITDTAGGREPMLRFVLPHADSAIVFEYQRGPDPERDLRCVVLRRQGASDAPEYRILPCGFNAAFFVRSTEQGQLCNDDDEMVNALIAAGVRPSPKLAINDYKHVILGTNSTSQQAGKLRLLSSEHSLAQRALPHMDRLIASVVKQEVNFNDFVRVAVTIVQDKLGTPGKGQDRARFTLRQSRSQIEQWISNRDACERALAMEPEVELLRQAISSHDRLYDQLRQEKAAVPPMLVLARSRHEHAQTSLNRLSERRNGQMQREAQRKSALEAEHNTGKNLVIQISQQVATEEALRASLHLDEVQQWAGDIESLDRLRAELSRTNELIQLTTAQAQDIEQRFDQLLRNLQQEHETYLLSLGRQETDLQTQYGSEIDQITSAAREQREALSPQQDKERKALADQREDLIGVIATAKALAANARARPETQEALETARGALAEHDDQLEDLLDASQRAGTQAREAMAAFEEAERSNQRSKATLEAARIRLSQAHELLAPADGTLLSALRSHHSQEWKSHLARVISPSLLHRTDLHPVPADAADQMPLLYGWHLQTDAIDPPDWADDDQLRARVEIEARSVELAQEASEQAAQALKDASAKNTAAEKAATLAKTELSLAQRTKQRLKDELKLAQERVDEDIRTEVRLATDRLQALQRQMQGLDLDYSELVKRHSMQLSQIDQQARQQQQQASARRDSALKHINTLRQSAASDLLARRQQIEKQRQSQLSDAGVDTTHLDSLRKQASDITAEIGQIEGRSATVNRWRAWIADGGHARLPEIKARLAQAEHQAEQAHTALEDHLRDMEDSHRAHASLMRDSEDELTNAQSDVDLLVALLERLGLNEHSGPALPSTRSATELQSSIRRLEGEIDSASIAIRTQFIRLRDSLCETPGPVRDLIEQSLKEAPTQDYPDSGLVGLARRLVTIHREMRRRVVPSINNSANTILESVRQFRVQIQAFESEMKRFNSALQKGLSRVSGFERLSKVEIHMTTDFSTLNFMKGLDAVDAAAREHIARGSVFSHKTELPDASVSGALRQLASLLGPDSALEVNLERHTMLRGSAHIDGKTRPFHNQNDIKHISSTGLSAILLISLLSGMLNMIRGEADVYMPWVSDEVGKFDVQNFAALMSMLKQNRIDPVTASPHLSPVQYRHFGRTYTFQSNGRIARWTNERPRLSRAVRSAS